MIRRLYPTLKPRPLTSLQAKVRIENPGSAHDTARCWCADCKALRAFAAGIVR